jgi:hypothetical protein
MAEETFDALSSDPFLDMNWFTVFKDMPWNVQKLSAHPFLTPQVIEATCDIVKFDWTIICSNLAVPIDYLKTKTDKGLCLETLSKRPDMTLRDMIYFIGSSDYLTNMIQQFAMESSDHVDAEVCAMLPDTFDLPEIDESPLPTSFMAISQNFDHEDFIDQFMASVDYRTSGRALVFADNDTQ